jgi:hypothetical protein
MPDKEHEVPNLFDGPFTQVGHVSEVKNDRIRRVGPEGVAELASRGFDGQGLEKLRYEHPKDKAAAQLETIDKLFHGPGPPRKAGTDAEEREARVRRPFTGLVSA